MLTATITQTLYERLGQKEGISQLVDTIVSNHMANPAISARFLPYLETPEKLAVTKQHLVHMLCAGTGGTETYSGRDMPSTHRGMNISEREYMATIDDILLAMTNHGYDEQTKKDVLYIAYSLKDQIIGI